MDKRLFLALVLTAIVIVTTPLLFPNAKRVPANATRDSVAALASKSAVPAAVSHTGGASAATVTGAPDVLGASATPAPLAIARVETTTVSVNRATYAFSSRGGSPVSIVLDNYASRRAGSKKGPVELLNTGSPLTHYRFVLGRDTIALDTIPLQVEKLTTSAVPSVRFTGTVAGQPLQLSYTFAPDTANSYVVHVAASVANAPAGSTMLVDLPSTLRSNEPDTIDDQHHLAAVFRPSKGEVGTLKYDKLEPSEVVVHAGPYSWVAMRNKYFLVTYRAEDAPFSTLRLQGGARQGKIAPVMTGTTAVPLNASGAARFNMYTGPQDFERLQRLGSDLEQVNPYQGFLSGAVQPFATMVMRALLWMKHTTKLNYGWVLVLFGIIVRLVLWPLNQGAMRTSMKMQRLQPELQAIQKKHSDDPKRQQEAIMKVYKDHGMSPLSPLMGCLPMLLPMPILFALYSVFQNTIEFRGVPFLWLPDISLHDPYYITPLLMGVSMFVMSWIGMRNSPPNPQAKMMLYMMPVMMTVLFLNFASGLNLYYAVQNIAALPQQWLLARERATAAGSASGAVTGTATPAVARRT